MSVTETIPETSPHENGTHENGTEPRRPITIAEVIRCQTRVETLLKQRQQAHEREVQETEARLQRMDWLRRCHADGFDVDRLAHVRSLFVLDGDLRLFDPETVERTIREVAEYGGCCLNWGAAKIIGKRDVQNRLLDEDERGSLIYLLANLYRLPPLVPKPAPAPAEEDAFTDD